MSRALRIIPRLDIKGPNLVKGMHLEGLRVLGRPEEFARYYYQKGADELIYQDVVASLYGRNSLNEIVSRTAKEVFIPLTVGGGIRSIENIAQVLRAGADKVSINTAAHENPDFVSEAAQIFGISTIVVAIEAIRQKDGSYQAFTDNGRNRTGRDVVSWAMEVEKRGAGEILITSVDREGTGTGLDFGLVESVLDLVKIPVVVHGGIGNINHILTAAEALPISGVSVASLLHYQYIQKNRNAESIKDEGNTEFLKSKKLFSKVDPVSISKLKRELYINGVNCRPV